MKARSLIQLTTDRFPQPLALVEHEGLQHPTPALPPKTNEDLELYCCLSPAVKQPTVDGNQRK